MQTTVQYGFVSSPIGNLLATASGDHLIGLYLPGHKGGLEPAPEWRPADEPFEELRRQLDGYFAGHRREFDLPLRLTGTEFQARVWRQLSRIPFGTTISYTELATRIDRPAASRAVGHANSKNPISIIVPCHRVIGANGSLTGYAGGLDTKRWLLDFEQSVCGQPLGEARQRALAI